MRQQNPGGAKRSEGHRSRSSPRMTRTRAVDAHQVPTDRANSGQRWSVAAYAQRSSESVDSAFRLIADESRMWYSIAKSRHAAAVSVWATAIFGAIHIPKEDARMPKDAVVLSISVWTTPRRGCAVPNGSNARPALGPRAESKLSNLDRARLSAESTLSDGTWLSTGAMQKAGETRHIRRRSQR